MTLVRGFAIQTRTQDKTIAVFADLTNYGAPEINRNQEAHFVMIAKMDENQNLVYILNIDNSAPLTALTYQFTENIDGAYRLLCFIPLSYSSVTSYVGETFDSLGKRLTYSSIVYHPSDNKFYKVKANVTTFSNIEPNVTVGWANYWQQITDFSTELLNPNITVFIQDDIVTFRYEDCLRDALINTADNILAGVCRTWEDLYTPLAMQLLLAGAQACNWENKAPRAEVIISEANKKFCCLC